MLDKIDILSFNLEKLQNAFVTLGLKKYNASQVYEWLHNKMEFDFDMEFGQQEEMEIGG